jgi:hypothetical protein
MGTESKCRAPDNAQRWSNALPRAAPQRSSAGGGARPARQDWLRRAFFPGSSQGTGLRKPSAWSCWSWCDLANNSWKWSSVKPV